MRNLGMFRTIALQVKPEHTIGTIKDLLRERIYQPNMKFELVQLRQVLHCPDMFVKDCNINNDATLTCVSFRYYKSPPPPIQSGGVQFEYYWPPERPIQTREILDRVEWNRPQDIDNIMKDVPPNSFTQNFANNNLRFFSQRCIPQTLPNFTYRLKIRTLRSNSWN